jgi:hypothetical protein
MANCVINQKAVLIILLVFVILFVFVVPRYEEFLNFGPTQVKTPLTYDYGIPNANQFRNYYRSDFHQGKNLGWKPTDEWEYLRPEANECTDCFKGDLDMTRIIPPRDNDLAYDNRVMKLELKK